MKYLLDTNICIYLIKKKPASLVRKLAKHNISDIGISSVTLAELECGIEKSTQPVRNRIALNEFLSPFDIHPFGNDAAYIYGVVRAYLEKRGTPIGPLDTMIAAHCRALGFTLVSNNLREFRRVPELMCENWVRTQHW